MAEKKICIFLKQKLYNLNSGGIKLFEKNCVKIILSIISLLVLVVSAPVYGS